MKPLTQEQFDTIEFFLAKDLSIIESSFSAFVAKFKPNPEQPTLIPFDLEMALANPERVVYRDGSKPLEWHWFEKAHMPIVSIDADKMICAHDINGSFSTRKDQESNIDLFLLPEAKKEYWINIFKNDTNGMAYASMPFETEAIAKDKIVPNSFYIKTISFTI